MTRRAAACLAAACVAVASIAGGARAADCRYPDSASPAAPDAAGDARDRFLPPDDVFRPLLADPREPRIFGSYRRTRFRSRGAGIERGGERRDTAYAGVGTDVGVWTRRTGDGCDGWQLSLGGSIVGQFDLDTPSRDLISSDFQIGAPLTLRRGPLSARLRVDHRSSHLGDEFLLNNPEVDPENLSYESAELLVSWDVRPEDAAGVRFYGGGGSIFHSRPHLDGGFVKWGVELRGAVHLLSAAVAVVPVVGADFGAVQQRSWRVTQSFVIGPELRVADSSRRMRILAGYLRGFLPYGPFFEAGRLEEYGITIQLDL